ncbi:MAG TPA: DMT family transporter [Thermoleophilia bacterium]|nr:DMT family transporter [Thermoleophilia bacterium]
MLAALLALAASFSWGVSNFTAGIESRRRSVWTVVAVSQAASALSAALLLPFAGGEALTAGHAVWAVIGGICGATGLVAYYRALALGAMSVVAPIIATQVLIPVTVGLALGERPAAAAYVGMVLAVAGVALVSRSGGSGRAHVPAAAILLAVLAAVVFGIMGVALDQSGSGSPLQSVFIVRLVSALVILVYFFASRRRFHMGARDLPALASVGILLTVANVLLTVAFTLGPLSIISVLGSLSPAVIVVLAQVVLRERLCARQWAGVAAVFAGVVLLSFA